MSIDSQAFKFDFFTISLRSLVIRQLVANSLKQRIFVDTHDSPFVQCVSPSKDELNRENIFNKLQFVANASEPHGSHGGNEQFSIKDKSSIQRKRRLSIKKKRRVTIKKKPSVRRSPPAHITRIRDSEFFDTCMLNGLNGQYSYTSGSCNPSFKGEN